MRHITFALIYFLIAFTHGFSQIQTIGFEQYKSSLKPKLKIENDNLYILSAKGIYYKNINNINSNSQWHSYLYGIPINNFANINGDIIAVADRFYLDNGLMYSNDNNEFEYYEPHDLILSEWENIIDICDNPNGSDIVFATEIYVYNSECINSKFTKSQGIGGIISIERNPICTNTIVCGYETGLGSLNNKQYIISFDSGQTWNFENNISGFLSATGIAFHPSDPNVIVLAGGNVVKSSDGGHSWEDMINDIHSYDQGEINDIAFDLRGGNRLFGTSQGKGMMYSDDFGKTWNEYYPIPTENSKITDFEQYGSKLYILMADYTLYVLDLELIDSAVEEVTEDSLSITISADTLQFSSASEIAQVEIYRADGMLLHSAESNANDGNIDISALSAGVHIAVFTTTDGQTISKKIHISH